ncbi:MAG: UDP-N-acetylglucosamine--N-acetylmuramyl-(pentapeptide) pyrophosphoryl-undecaprenol N-acetylglucosamine transferase [Planctomycetota bacterium]
MMRMLLAAGGTGGHLRPAISTAHALVRLEPSVKLLFLTAGRPVAERFLDGEPFAREALFPGRPSAPKRRDLFAWWGAYRRACALIREFDPDVVVGFGGYPTAVAGAASLAGATGPLGVLWRLMTGHSLRPLILLEQNAKPGLAVRVLARCARFVLLSMRLPREELPDRTSVVVTGNPLPREFERPDKVEVDPRDFGLEPGRPILVVLGGSQGARGVNRMVLAARRRLAEAHPELQILLITGDGDFAEVQEALRHDPAPRTVAVPFETRMLEAYTLADVVVARAGGTTLAELAVVGRPMVLVPYPHHRDGHQFANAEVFERVGAARVVPEGPGAADRLADEIGRWLQDGASRREAGDCARRLGFPDAAERCAELILNSCERAE